MTEPRRTVEGAGPGDPDDWNEDPEPAAPAPAGLLREAAPFLDHWRREVGHREVDPSLPWPDHEVVDLAARFLALIAALAATGDSEGPEERCYCAAHPHNGHPVDKDTDRLSSKGYDKADHAAREGVPE